MRILSMLLVTGLLIAFTGCFGGGGANPVLMGQMPRGYHMYITIDPEAINIARLLEALEESLPEDVLEDIDEEDLGLNPFDWAEWKESFSIEDGEIGLMSLTEDEEFVAIFLPCSDQSKLEEFIEDGDFGDTEFFTHGEYTVLVVSCDDDDLLDDLEDALEDDLLATDEEYQRMLAANDSDNSCMQFMFSKAVAEVPIYAALSLNENESVFKTTVIAEDTELDEYIGVLGEGLISNNIKFPDNTMAATRLTLDIEWLIEEYDNLADDSGNRDLDDVESGLPFIGFSTMEEFLGIFQGDFCVAVQEIELDSYGEPEGAEGVLAISLTDSEKLSASLSSVAMMAEADTDEVNGVDVYGISESGEDIWFFINDDVFYISMNIDPEDIIDGISAGDYFHGGIASEGFMGGTADPEKIMDGIQTEEDVQDIIEAIFENRADFSITVNGQIFTSTITAGPDVLESLVSLAGLMAASGYDSASSIEMI